jgi:quercetin dioxygenase-like cupin family protein
MKIVDTHKSQWHTGPGHREPGVYLRDLATGEEGGPDNFWFVEVRVEEKYDTPLHHHNFEQVRVMLEGKFNFGPQDQDEGTVGYFSEGTAYEQNARGPSRMLLLQCEGGSRSRYLSQSEMRRAVLTLKEMGGSFDGGIYRGPDRNGISIEKDAVEALWEFATGDTLVYPQPRVQGPVIMRPEAYFFEPAGTAGVSIKRLGEFGERQLALGYVKVEPGASWNGGDPVARRLIYILSGDAECEGQHLSDGGLVVLERDETTTISGAGEAGYEAMAFGLPR